MRLLPVALAAMFLAVAARADEAEPAAPARHGYAFDYPRVLAQQRLFGIAHGVALLAGACDQTPAAQEAYAAWHDRQQGAIDSAIGDLAAYYEEDNPGAPAIAQRLQLRPALDYPPDSPELAAACATLPEALAQPRYDLAARFRLEELMTRLIAAVDIEARDRYCRDKLSELALRLHRVRYHLWREINDPLLEQSSAALERDWPADAPTATFAEWLAELRRDTRAGGSEAACLEFSESLKRPESALRNVFLMPPRRPK